jgi:hypothetical protein
MGSYLVVLVRGGIWSSMFFLLTFPIFTLDLTLNMGATGVSIPDSDPSFSDFIGFAYQGKANIVFRFIIE